MACPGRPPHGRPGPSPQPTGARRDRKPALTRGNGHHWSNPGRRRTGACVLLISGSGFESLTAHIPPAESPGVSGALGVWGHLWDHRRLEQIEYIDPPAATYFAAQQPHHAGRQREKQPQHRRGEQLEPSDAGDRVVLQGCLRRPRSNHAAEPLHNAFFLLGSVASAQARPRGRRPGAWRAPEGPLDRRPSNAPAASPQRCCAASPAGGRGRVAAANGVSEGAVPRSA